MGSSGAHPLAGVELDAIEEELWSALVRGRADRRHPFHTPVVASVDADGLPTARTVVLRRVDRASRTLAFHTDVRSAKVAGLRERPRVAWTFYEPGAKLQIRAEGAVRLHIADEEDQLARDAWNATTLGSRRCYLVDAAPGSPIGHPGDAAPPNLRQSSAEDRGRSESGASVFVVVASTIERFEWLVLSHTAHRRAELRWDAGQARYAARWVAA